MTVSQARQPAPAAALELVLQEHKLPIVAAVGLTKRFGRSAPIERLDASFAPGKLTVVTGPSGSGKTTLLLLAGLELPDEGDVLLDGVSLGGLDRAGRAELRRTSLAFVGQTTGSPRSSVRARTSSLRSSCAACRTTAPRRRSPRSGSPSTPTVRSPSSRPAARAGRARARPRGSAARDRRRRADRQARRRQRARARCAPRRPREDDGRNRDLCHARSAPDRAGGRRALARIAAMATVSDVIQVSGVRCERCVGRLAGTLRQVDGIESANANLMGQVSLSWDDESDEPRGDRRDAEARRLSGARPGNRRAAGAFFTPSDRLLGWPGE